MGKQTKKLSDKIMLVTISIHQWYPRKKDPKATAELANLHGVDPERAGNFHKILVDLKSIKPLQQRCRKLRDEHYEMTSPWGDNGERAMPAQIYFDYVEMMREAIQEIDALADAYEVEYSNEVDKARSELNGMFNEADYPAPHEMRSRFSVDYRFEPVANADDVRVWGLGDAAAKEIEEEVRTATENRIADAQNHVIRQVVERAREFIEKVQHFDEQVYNDVKGPRLYDSAIANLRDVMTLVLSGMNFTGDQELTKLCKDLQKSLKGVHTTGLKNSKSTRDDSTEAVEAVLEKSLEKFRGVF